MNCLILRPLWCVLLLLSGASFTPVYAGLRDNNLIEFSLGSYGETTIGIRAMFWPPIVKIYQDGKVIYYEGDDDPRYFVSQIEPQQLDSLKKRLAEEKYLRKSRFIEMEGDDVNIHGGVSYIRYLDGDKEILLATEVSPKGGPWVKLTDEIWEYVPDDHGRVFNPVSMGVYTSKAIPPFYGPFPPVWPFDKLHLSPKLKTISDAEIIVYLFERLTRSFSFFVWEFKAGSSQ